MSWWDQLLSKETRGRHRQSRDEETFEIEARQPFSDGSEEFLEEFMPRDDQNWRPNKQVLIGLGITAGVLAGVGIAVWLKKGKRRKTWRDFIPKK
jgi:hypothetical protein